MRNMKLTVKQIEEMADVFLQYIDGWINYSENSKISD